MNVEQYTVTVAHFHGGSAAMELRRSRGTKCSLCGKRGHKRGTCNYPDVAHMIGQIKPSTLKSLRVLLKEEEVASIARPESVTNAHLPPSNPFPFEISFDRELQL
jgi:hypothetical protein